MKYIIRLIAAIPMLATGLSMVFFLVLAFEYSIFALLAIGDFLAFIFISNYYEYMVDELKDVVKTICDKTPVYHE